MIVKYCNPGVYKAIVVADAMDNDWGNNHCPILRLGIRAQSLCVKLNVIILNPVQSSSLIHQHVNELVCPPLNPSGFPWGFSLKRPHKESGIRISQSNTSLSCASVFISNDFP